jgi:hypothetical protein
MEQEQKAKEELYWVEEISRIMDSGFRFPGTNFRFGLDPIIGLIPGVGDIASYAVSAVLVYIMAKYGVSGRVVVLMALNITLDATIGSIPVIGAIFDFFYKANDRNIRLLKKHYHEGKYQGSGAGTLITIGIVLLLFFILLIYLSYLLVKFIIGLF